jgi:cell division protein FtsI (penicillin-binding protein 3)
VALPKNILTRSYLLYIAIVVFSLAIVYKIFDISVLERDKWEEKKETLILDMKTIKAPRGNIYAGNDKRHALAISVPRYKVYMDMTVAKEETFNKYIDSLCDGLSLLFPDKTKQEWKSNLVKQRARNNQFYLIRNKVRYEELEQLKELPLLRLGQYRGGVIIMKENKRVKPYGLLAERTLGYVIHNNNDSIRVGLEGYFDSYLSGRDGKQLMKRVVGGDWKPVSTEYDVEPVNGYDLYTSIDIGIQDVAESALKKQLIDQRAKIGCVIVMEVETGYIKAIANLQRDSLDRCFETFNMAIGRRSEPGSTIKLASLITAIEHGKISPDDIVNANGSYRFYSKILKDSHEEGYGKITVHRAFEVSSNVIAKIINDNYRNNPQEYIDGLKKLGIHEKTGFTITGEPNPIVKNANDSTFSGTTIPWMSIGYEIELTPMQLLTFYNGIANNGKVMKPQIVTEIRNNNQLIEKFEPIVLRDKICSENTIKIAKSMMEGVVENGTARNVRARGFSIAGKTGTAQIIENGTYQKKYQASFCGYFPADKPKYSCVVVIQGPTRNIYGSIVSGGVFKEIADKVYASSLDINQKIKNDSLLANNPQPYSKSGSKQETELALNFFKVNYTKSDAQYIGTEATKDNIVFYKREIEKNKVPNVLGMGLKDALYLLEQKGIKVEAKGIGRVVSQSLQPGTIITNDTQIIIALR